MHRRAMRGFAILGMQLEAAVENLDEPRVEFHEVEAILIANLSHNVPRDGAGAGADLQNPRRPWPSREWLGECLGEKSAARGDRTRRRERLAELAEEIEVIDECLFHRFCSAAMRRI